MKESASPGSPVIRSRIPIMPKTSSDFDFRKPVAYDGEAKRAFHNHARRRLKQLADALGLAPGSFDLRSNPGGIAVMWNALTEGPRIRDESAGFAHGSRSFAAADLC